jgi:type I restriction enzyme M protein
VNLAFRVAVVEAIQANRASNRVVTAIAMDAKGEGTITYNGAGVSVDPRAPGFNGIIAPITDEELVRAHLLVDLTTRLGYAADPEVLQVECVFRPVGRPIGKGGRIDILVRQPPSNGTQGKCFFFIEVKAPDKFDSDIGMIDGQLFRLSMQEQPRPKYLVYYTCQLTPTGLSNRLILIDTATFQTFERWDEAGQPIVDALPVRYGRPPVRRFANVDNETQTFKPLDRVVTPETFARIRSEIHDVIWGGGGTNNNEVFVCITRLILCKIFDEKESAPGAIFDFQRLGDAAAPEDPGELVKRLNGLYAKAEDAYLALPQPSAGPAFDISRISAEKLAYVVGRLEGISVTENLHPGDLLGEFFEQIVSQDFTQSRGQFFTPPKVVYFMLALCDATGMAKRVMLEERDHLGRPRLPYVIDPSAGSGTFLIEYMKLVSASLGRAQVRKKLPKRVQEAHAVWFGNGRANTWAREFIYGIENNYDLGLAAKVNMVLHGDGSMNTWIASGLLPFPDYYIDGRTNLLATARKPSALYEAPTNEQFDLVLSNPPFSLVMADAEKARVRAAFPQGGGGLSEKIFVERWFQLLRPGGSLCCVLPETILDTYANEVLRLFLLQHFRINAVVALPYDSFRPFTSTKTCIVFATKRKASDAEAWATAWHEVSAVADANTSRAQIAGKVLASLGWHNEAIFMAEPTTVGYKRRKGLSDLPARNELFTEDASGKPAAEDAGKLTSVLGHYRANPKTPPSAKLGFWVTLSQVVSRTGCRLDPKYRWLWDFQSGVAFGSPKTACPLGKHLVLVELQKVAKGGLDSETLLVDLEAVEARQALIRNGVERVDTIGSDKVRFDGAELLFSKLEPYLGKVIIGPPEGAIGSTEWIGLNRVTDYPLLTIAYLLMVPSMCEAYRRLQSGKRHARLDPEEMLHLRVDVPGPKEAKALEAEIAKARTRIIALREEEKAERARVDEKFARPHANGAVAVRSSGRGSRKAAPIGD